MASVGMFKLASGELNGGGEHEWIWNNPPFERVWQATVVPSCLSDYYGSTSLAKAEVTMLQLEQERIGFEGSGQTETPIFKRRLRVRVKNTGGQKIHYSLFLSHTAP